MKRLIAILLLTGVLAGCGTSTVMLAESDETVQNWALARNYQAQGRYELAQQHYSLALSAVRTQGAMDMLTREFAAVDMQLRAMR